GVLELVNLVGSVFYGPVLGVFTLGVLAPAVRGRHAVGALCAGLGCNLLLATLVPAISWLWWNPAGWLVTVAFALAFARAPLKLPEVVTRRAETVALVGGFVFMLALLVWL
ncbi:MAG: hypothetical protein ACREI7_02425, partial [Myxococcota bacterium]